ncbi:MAG: radical SAM protein [Desulfopila sp.]
MSTKKTQRLRNQRETTHPGRDSRKIRLDAERGVYLKKWKDKTPVALIYPNRYDLGMSSLGFQLVYALLNERDDVVCERFFLPGPDEELVSMESDRPLQDFPFLFFSISFEHDYSNIVRMLLRAGLEPFAEKRARSTANTPLVVFGGVACFMNPEPIAPFSDIIVVGEAEPVLPELVDVFLETHGNRPRQQILHDAVCRLDGVYAPALYTPQYDDSGRYQSLLPQPGVPERVRRRSLMHCTTAGHSELLTPAAEFSDLYLTELGRGCSRGCRFCTAGFIYRPPRLWDADAVLAALKERGEGVERVGLLGMEMAGDATLEHISNYILEGGCALSFSSLRADRIHDSLCELLSKSELKSVAIAPDGASERLRRVINKGLTAQDLLEGARRLVEASIYKLKIYVMVGLPTETYEDLQEFIDLLAVMKSEIDEIGKKRGRLTEMYLSVNCFVPKPWTPFQYHPFGMSERLAPGELGDGSRALKNLKAKIGYLKKGVKGLANVHFQADKPENAYFQALLSRGDRRLAQVLYDMAAFQLSWKASVKNNTIVPEQLIICGYDRNTMFPWYVLDHGIEPDYLWREYVKGFEAKLSAACDTSICRRCGVCRER